jgi:hypothetical protein
MFLVLLYERRSETEESEIIESERIHVITTRTTIEEIVLRRSVHHLHKCLCTKPLLQDDQVHRALGAPSERSSPLLWLLLPTMEAAEEELRGTILDKLLDHTVSSWGTISPNLRKRGEVWKGLTA